MKRLFVICLSALIFYGCATGYQSKGFRGGFEDSQLDDNVFKVMFAGNNYTSKEKTNDFCLIRCCEVAMDNSYKYFVVSDNQDFSTSETEYVPQKDFRGTVIVQERTSSKKKIELTITCYNDKPKTDVTVYNAEITMKNLKRKYGIE